MVDIHSHILPSIDDGAQSPEASLLMAQIAENEKIKHIIATPHYIPGEIEYKKEDVDYRVALLQSKLTQEGLDIKIHTGSEIYLDAAVPALLDEGRVYTLADSRYVLVEFPMMEVPYYAEEVLYEICVRGYTPIIAHPERNAQIIETPQILAELIKREVLVQVNSTSITGMVGREARETALLLIKHNMVHFIATDAHTSNRRAPRLLEARKVVEKKFGMKKAEELFIINSKKIIRDETITAPEQIPLKKKSLLRIFF